MDCIQPIKPMKCDVCNIKKMDAVMEYRCSVCHLDVCRSCCALYREALIRDGVPVGTLTCEEEEQDIKEK